MSKRIAIVGSSGGNLYNQGGSNPAAMMKEIFTQADSAGIEIAFIQFIGAQATMDNISMDTAAQLFTLAEGQVEAGESAPLREINQQAQSLDEELARLIDEGEIDGLVLMSCDPKGVNSRAVAAAAKQVSGLDEVGIVAGIICGVMSTDGGTSAALSPASWPVSWPTTSSPSASATRCPAPPPTSPPAAWPA